MRESRDTVLPVPLGISRTQWPCQFLYFSHIIYFLKHEQQAIKKFYEFFNDYKIIHIIKVNKIKYIYLENQFFFQKYVIVIIILKYYLYFYLNFHSSA